MTPTHRFRGLILACASLTLVFAVSSAALSAATSPPRLQQAIGCLLSRRPVRDALHDLHLKPGDAAWVRYYVGSIPGGGATPGEYYIAVYAHDGNSAWLRLTYPDSHGKFVPVENGYRLRKLHGRWQADEGNGELGTYRTMSHFAAWLEQHRQRHRVPLVPRPQSCAPEPAALH